MGNAWKILVVEDDPELREALVEQLALQDEFEPMPVGTAAEAIESARNGAVDLVIMDVGLPDMDGRDAVRQIRANGFKGPHPDAHRARYRQRHHPRSRGWRQ